MIGLIWYLNLGPLPIVKIKFNFYFSMSLTKAFASLAMSSMISSAWGVRIDASAGSDEITLDYDIYERLAQI